jgi:hypothetical protein
VERLPESYGRRALDKTSPQPWLRLEPCGVPFHISFLHRPTESGNFSEQRRVLLGWAMPIFNAILEAMATTNRPGKIKANTFDRPVIT